MSAYLICRAKAEDLETIIFSVGPHKQQEAVAVFTDLNAAESYIHEAGWAGKYTVATLEPIPFLRWLLRVYEESVRHLVINPNYADHQAGVRLSTLDLERHLEHAGSQVLEVASPDFQ